MGSPHNPNSKLMTEAYSHSGVYHEVKVFQFDWPHTKPVAFDADDPRVVV